jgi:hypothetical protein
MGSAFRTRWCRFKPTAGETPCDQQERGGLRSAVREVLNTLKLRLYGTLSPVGVHLVSDLFRRLCCRERFSFVFTTVAHTACMLNSSFEGAGSAVGCQTGGWFLHACRESKYLY